MLGSASIACLLVLLDSRAAAAQVLLGLPQAVTEGDRFREQPQCTFPKTLLTFPAAQSRDPQIESTVLGHGLRANPSHHPHQAVPPPVTDSSPVLSQQPLFSQQLHEAENADFSRPIFPWADRAYDPAEQAYVYDEKYEVPTERPWLELGIPFYDTGLLPRGGAAIFGASNLTHPAFYVYGDYRIGMAAGRNVLGRTDNIAHRLNLDFDLRLTATERFHAFIGPLNKAAQFSQARFIDGRVEFDPNFNLIPVTGFFEGDLGAIAGGFQGRSTTQHLPVAAGLVPLLFQNGIWMEDAVTGVAMAIPARNSASLDWSNFDVMGFAVVDQLLSPAFGNDPHAAQALGTALFLDAYQGYIEAGYAYLHDRIGLGRSYHNITVSYTRRYFDRINNSVRVIINAGQDLPADQRTADGGLLLIENSLVTDNPFAVLPYMNIFVGWDRPQSVARAGVSGEILRNVGLNFDPDGLNGHPTLDGSGNNTVGGVIGIDLLGTKLDRQLIVELAYLTVHGDSSGRIARGSQRGLAGRYQFPISHRTLLRFDAMYGWRNNDHDIYGTRMELRWKF